jgi:CubicO group peptidase (beta-lactamase class C family)
MMKSLRMSFFLAAIAATSLRAEQVDTFDYFTANRTMIRNGVQAIMMCNGLFTSNRTLQQVFAQELKYLPDPVGTADGGEYTVDTARRAVAVGGTNTGTPVAAAFREGIGCVVMAPDQTFDDIEALPKLNLPQLPGNADDIAWPDGDLLPEPSTLPAFNNAALQRASDWAFNRESVEQVTISLLVVYKGQLVHERYAAGFDRRTRTRTWSTAKSIAATLIGILVDDGRMKLDEPLGITWLPELRSPESDPRQNITLRHVLNMSSGLEPVDSFRMEYATGSGLAYWAGMSSISGARNRGLVRAPGTVFEYENYDTLLAVLAMKNALGDDETYQQFPRKALLDRIGMRNTLISADRFHDFILSSQVYTNARDLARFGLLHLQDGIWNGERLISSEWIDFVRTPAPSTVEIGNFYGGQWWLVPDDRSDVPKNAYKTSGNRGQYVVIVPSHELVIVRRGLDYGRQGFDAWDLVREVMKAIPRVPEANMPGQNPD